MTTAIETWRPIPGYEGYYEVSDCGRVQSVDRVIPVSGEGRRGKSQNRRGRILTFRSDPRSGRRRVTLCRDGRMRSYCIATLVLETFVGSRPVGMEVCHNDGDATNDCVINLRWDTHKENQCDIVRHGHHNEAKKTHCPFGHPLVVPNLEPWALGIGKRKCLACARARTRVRDARQRGQVLDRAATSHDYYASLTGGSP